MIGKTIAHYKIVSELGRGGMGVVYKAEDSKLHRTVALKFLPPEMIRDDEAKTRFVREARAAAALTHPNIATVYEINEAEGHTYIAMEYVEGESLRDKIRSGQLSVDEALALTTQVARGLSKAHSKGIVHRDIKPGNILLTLEGDAKIVDFGLAKLGAQSRLTISGTTLGTAAYMSPEQARGEETDQRADVFSLGVVFYELLTGAVPFAADYELAVIYQIMNEDPEPLSHHRDGLPASAQRVIDKALAKNREERYLSAGELLEDLEKLKGGHAVTAIRKRSRWMSIAVGALFGMVALGASYLLYSRFAPDADNGPIAVSANVMAVFPFSLNGSEEFSYLGEGMVDLLNMCIDGAGDLVVVDSGALLNAVSRESEGELDQARSESLARSLGAGLFVRGNLLEAGGRFQATATLYAADGSWESTARAMVEEEAKVFDLAQDLARQFLLELTGEDSGGGIGSVDTSFEALRAFLEGERRFRRGEFEAAMDSYQQAVDVDSTLARAWAKLARAAAFTPKYSDIQREATRRALELRDRLSTRDRSLLEAHDAFANGRFDEAEQLLRGIVASHPTDGTAWVLLGDVLLANAAMRARSFDEVVDVMERAIALGVREENALINKYWAFAAGGKPDRALECLERYLELNPKGDNTVWFRTILAFQRGSADDREVAIERLRQADPGFVLLVVGNLVWFENLSGAARAARIFTDAANQSEFRARGYIELAQIDLAQGKWRAAQANLDAAELLDPSDALEYRALLSAAPFLETRADELRALRETLERWDPKGPPAGAPTNPWITPHEGVHPHIRLYLLGLLSARLGDQEKSAQYADELASLGGNEEAVAVAKHLSWCVRAHIDVVAENQEAALEKLELGRLRGASWEKSGCSAFYSQVYERYMRAEVLRAMGQNPDALRWYETVSKQSSFDVVYLAPSYLRRAEIYEQLGEKKKAIEHYRRFLELWKECDPELRPTFEKAQISLARLEG